EERQLDLRRAEVALEKAKDELAAHQKSAALEVKVKQIALEKALRDIHTAESAIESLVLVAPRDGIFLVGEHPWEGRKFQVGDNLWVGLRVGRLPDLSVMKVKAMLSDVDDGRISVGLPVRCVLDAYPDLTFPGVIKQIGPVAREPAQRSLRRSFVVTVELE